jgi:transcriptional regulator
VYVPSYHEETNLDVLHGLMRAHPLGAWVTLGAAGLTANHIPFVLDTSRGQYGTLRAHVSRANTVWKELSTTVPSIVMFQGPQSYITPSWYPTKPAEGKVVPTWNYAVVHAHGTPIVIHDRDWILQAITDLTNQSESQRLEPWKVSDAPHEFIDRLLGAIVGIEIPISEITGKWKVSQDEALPDRIGTAEALLKLDDPNSRALSDLVSARIA